MSILKAQLAQIGRLQAFPTEQKDDRLSPLSFVLEVDPPQTRSSLFKALTKALPGLKFSLETVFDSDEEPRFFRIEFENVSFNDISGSYFEIAYYLEEVLGLVSCDTDLETDFHPWDFDRDIEESEQGFIGGAPLSGLGAIKQICFLRENDESKPTDEAWALQATKVDEARLAYGVSGKGVTLAQIDTGVAKHVELENLTIDKELGFNLYKPEKGAIDPLKNRLFGFFDQKGHGTATSAVIVSQGGFIADGERLEATPPGQITGVAPDVEFMPIRAIRSVLRVSQGRVAKAVDLARRNGAHIITMSMGGVPSRALRHAIARAVQENIIVMAAAGNCVKLVVYPAAYDHCIAVAGVNRAGKRWRGSCRGPEVNFSAPGEFVWTARRKKQNDADLSKVNAGQGTSFSVALSAGIAALWLERHGRDQLIEGLESHETLQSRFIHAVQQSAQVFPDWPSNTMGDGIINAFGLMENGTIPAPQNFAGGLTASDSGNASVQTISDSDRLKSLLTTFSSEPRFSSPFGRQATSDSLEKYSAEVLWRLMREQQRHLRSNDDVPLPPRSSYLEDMLARLEDTIVADIP